MILRTVQIESCIITQYIGENYVKIVHKIVFNFFSAKNVITSLNHAFFPGDFNADQLVDIYNTFSKVLDDGLGYK